MARIYTAADQLIGGTPLLELKHIEAAEGLIPVYRNIAGIPPKALKSSVEAALKICEGQ